MSKLVKLDAAQHQHLKLVENCAITAVSAQHIVSLRAMETIKAVSCFPIFLTKIAQSGDWSISAMTSLTPNTNLFVKDGEWRASYKPVGMATYPFFYMQPEAGSDRKYDIGIDEQNQAFSTTEGEDLFDSNGQQTDRLRSAMQLLDNDIANSIHSHQFTQTLEGLELIKEMRLNVQSVDGNINTFTGIHTIDEEKLLALDADALKNLRDQHFLPVIYALLCSIHQLNSLIQRHNQAIDAGELDANKVAQVSLEVAKDPA